MAGITCTKCSAEIQAGLLNLPDFTPCQSCGTPFIANVFPALYRQEDALNAARVSEGQSSCFYHPANSAMNACERCGRFLCSVCDIELEGSHICPACLSTGRKKGLINNLNTQRTLYDSVALKISLYPLLLFPFTIFTAPFSIYFAIKNRNSPISILSRSRYKFILAILLSSIQIIGWLAVIVMAIG